MKPVQALRRQNTFVRALVVAGVLLVAGLIALNASSAIAPATPRPDPGLLSTQHASNVLSEFGSLLVGSAALAVMWDLVARRAFVDELLGRIGGVESLEDGGLTGFSMHFHDTIPWAKLIGDAKRVDVLMAWGTGWRAIALPHLQDMVGRRGASLRVVLPDPTDTNVISALAARFDMTSDQVVARVEDAISDFVGIRPTKSPDRVKVLLTKEPLLFSSCLIDRTGVISLYTHAPNDRDVATFICAEGGTLHEFLRSEFALFTSGEVPVREQ